MTCDFSYNHYIETIKKSNPDMLFIRHDIDMSLEKALDMARVESENGIKATYFILLTNPYFNPLSEISNIKKILEYGHKIGLHYDFVITGEIYPQILMLEELLNTKIEYVSYHNPTLGVKPTVEFTSNLLVSYGLVDVSTVGKYVSDSGKNWREGCFCQHIGKHNLLQVNTHPEWWGDIDEDSSKTYDKIKKKHMEKVEKVYKLASDNLREYYDKLGIH